jgi:hypothetical protein
MRLALALLGIVLLATNAALVQDPRTTSVQQAARALLALTDREDGMASRQLAGKQFQNDRADARETVTLEREPDGTWRVIGYFIR